MGAIKFLHKVSKTEIYHIGAWKGGSVLLSI